MSSRTRRIAKEIGDIEADRATNLFVALADPASGNLTHLKASILGPPGTPYEGGTFMVDIKMPNDYPFRPPVMKFDTKVWHPNISSQTVYPPQNSPWGFVVVLTLLSRVPFVLTPSVPAGHLS